MWIDDLRQAVTKLAAASRGYIVIEIADTGQYVQLLRDEGRPGVPRALVEAVSNEYLMGEHRLSSAQEHTLSTLGWEPPHGECHPAEGCEMPHPNWFRFVDVDPSDAGLQAIEGIVLAALGVYGLGEGKAVRVALDCS
jgi:hypothetical protein